MKQVLIYLLAVVAGLAPQSLLGQASVNEGLETAFIYVDGNKGNDSNPGTQSQPLKTLTAATNMALSNNYHNIGSRIYVNPAIYREDVVVMGNQYNTSLPITYQATAAGVVVSGSVPYTGWQPYSGNASIYTAPWNNTWGLCAPNLGGPQEADVVLRREMVFVNAVLMTQVMKLSQMLPGTFFVDETNHLMYVWPPAGTNMSTASVEVGSLPEVFHLVSVSNVVVRGMTFQHAASCRDNNAVYVAGNASNILFDSDTISWNNAIGLHFFNPVANITVQNTVANHNGQSGMMSVQVKYALWSSDTASFNNWRGAQGSYYYWNSGGLHFFSDHNHTLQGIVAAYNQTHGIHWDTDNASIAANDVVAVQDLGMGAVVEKSEGPVSVSNSYFCGNNLGVKYNYLYSGGFVLRNSENVTLSGSSFYNNQISQIDVIGQPGGIQITNWETGQVYNLVTKNFTHQGNHLQAVGSQNTFTDAYLSGSDWTAFQSTLNSNKNTYWNANNTTVFETPVGQMNPLSAWQSATAQDGLSSWAQPPSLSGVCGVQSAYDYWLLADNASYTLDETGGTVLNLSMVPFGGFSGNASLSLDGISQVRGLSGSLSATSVPVSGGTTLNLKAAMTTAPGTYPITTLATANGVTRTVTAYVTVPVTSLRFSSLGLNFGNQKAKTSSAPHTFTITNFGKTAVSLNSWTFKGAKDYTQTNNCGTSLAAGTSCTISVVFTPKVTGPRNGSLTIADSDLTSPQVITLTGSGN